jgi:hypothetical protein
VIQQDKIVSNRRISDMGATLARKGARRHKAEGESICGGSYAQGNGQPASDDGGKESD